MGGFDQEWMQTVPVYGWPCELAQVQHETSMHANMKELLGSELLDEVGQRGLVEVTLESERTRERTHWSTWSCQSPKRLRRLASQLQNHSKSRLQLGLEASKVVRASVCESRGTVGYSIRARISAGVRHVYSWNIDSRHAARELRNSLAVTRHAVRQRREEFQPVSYHVDITFWATLFEDLTDSAEPVTLNDPAIQANFCASVEPLFDHDQQQKTLDCGNFVKQSPKKDEFTKELLEYHEKGTEAVKRTRDMYS